MGRDQTETQGLRMKYKLLVRPDAEADIKEAHLRSNPVHLVMEATYKDGVLIPDQPLGAEKEGRRFKIIVVAEEQSAAKSDGFSVMATPAVHEKEQCL